MYGRSEGLSSCSGEACLFKSVRSPDGRVSFILDRSRLIMFTMFLFFSTVYLIAGVDSLKSQLDFSSDPNFSALRTCGNCCLCAGLNCTASQCIRTPVGCDNNVCLCNSAALSLGYLDTCVRAACALQPEEAALSYKDMFSSYCQSLPTSTTSMVPPATVTPSSKPTTSHNGDLSQTTTQLAIPLGVGLGVGIPTILIALFFGYCTIHRASKRKHRERVLELEEQLRRRDAEDNDRKAADEVLGRGVRLMLTSTDPASRSRVAGLLEGV